MKTYVVETWRKKFLVQANDLASALMTKLPSDERDITRRVYEASSSDIHNITLQLGLQEGK